MTTRWTAVEGQPGEVVLARVSNPLENPRSTGKVRPVVLIRRRLGSWDVMGLTTNPRFRDGTPRMPVPDSSAVGLQRGGYLWGTRLTRVSVLDLDRHLGWVDAELAAALIVAADLDRMDAAALIRAVHSASSAA